MGDDQFISTQMLVHLQRTTRVRSLPVGQHQSGGREKEKAIKSEIIARGHFARGRASKEGERERPLQVDVDS